MEDHNHLVLKISAHVRRFHHQKAPFRIYHGATNSTRKTILQRDRLIDTSGLSRILAIDRVKKTALVEPNVSFGSLTRATLEHQLLPLVVPEFPGITVGGGFAGVAAESSSYKHGLFEDTVNWVEFVRANGAIGRISRDVEPELFHGVTGTFGTLGVVTLLEIKLLKAISFVEVVYHPVHSVHETLRTTQRAMEDGDNAFVDAILFDATRGAVVTGRFTDRIRPWNHTQTFLKREDEWFYLHVENTILSRNSTTVTVETVPTLDYLFRYNRGAFWAARHAFTYFGFPFTPFTRRLLDPLMCTEVLYHGLHENGMARDNIIQDITLPLSNTEPFIEWLDKELSIYPLWICPVLQNGRRTMFNRAVDRPSVTAHIPDEKPQPRGSQQRSDANSDIAATADVGEKALLMNIGVWGPRLPNPEEFVAENRRLERKVRELGGVKWLYAHCHYTEEDFWKIYDREWYDDLRTKHHATYLPSVYEKTKFDWGAEQRAIDGSWLRWLFSFIWFIWPVPGIYGVICVLLHSEYLLGS